MTLHTRIAVTAEGLDPKGAFDYARGLLGIPDTADWFRDGEDLHMTIGQGFDAFMWVTVSDGVPEEHYEWCSYEAEDGTLVLGCDGRYHYPGHYVMVHLDTSYGYQAPNGAGCGDLHAWLVQEMGKWLSNGDLPWVWYDESGDGWQTTPEQVKDLSGLGDPEVGRPGSTVPKQARDPRREMVEGLAQTLQGLGFNVEVDR